MLQKGRPRLATEGLRELRSISISPDMIPKTQPHSSLHRPPQLWQLNCSPRGAVNITSATGYSHLRRENAASVEASCTRLGMGV